MTPALLLALGLAAPPVAAEAGRTGAAILQRTLGARAAAMGDAGVALTGDPEGVLHNPAGPVFSSSVTVAASYLSGFDADDHGLLALTIPLGRRWKGWEGRRLALTGGVLYYNSGLIDIHLSDGTDAFLTAEEDYVGILGLAFRPVRFLALGGAAKYTRLRLAGTLEAEAWHGDAGAVVVLPLGFTAAAAWQNIGQDIKFESVGDPPPETIRAGASSTWAYKGKLPLMDFAGDIIDTRLTLSAQWVKVKFEKARYEVGFEWGVNPGVGDMIFFRGGYLIDRESLTYTAGVGVRQGRLEADYAYAPSRILLNRHFVTLKYRFGS